MRRYLAAFAFALVAPPVGGCTIREECLDRVTTTTTSELGFASIERCGIGHCMKIERIGEPRLRFRMPTEPGTTTLEELEARLCTDAYFETCEPVTGTMVVRAVHPPAEGQPVGRLDAELSIEGSQGAKVTIDYQERFTPMCHDVDWPDVRVPLFPGPGQL